MLDFQRIKEIPIVEVVARYGVQLRFRGEWGSALCPLPSHKQGEKEKTFSVSTAQNYFKCFSQSCNEQAGCKGGDVINFVALMDNSSQLAAAKKLAGWYGIGETSKPTSTQTKTPQHIAKGSSEKPEIQKATSENSTSGDSVKYMASIDAWFNETFKRGEKETDVEYWARTLKATKSKLVESFRAGKKAA